MKYVRKNNIINIEHGTAQDGTAQMTIRHEARHTDLYCGTPIDWHTFLLGYISAIGTTKSWSAQIKAQDGTITTEEL